jgi:hypothetical protein
LLLLLLVAATGSFKTLEESKAENARRRKRKKEKDEGEWDYSGSDSDSDSERSNESTPKIRGRMVSRSEQVAGV